MAQPDPSTDADAPTASDASEHPPDAAEESRPGDLDNTVPARDVSMLPVVGIGGSAGGIQALRAFFAHTVTPTGLAYVVVLHLAPEHESTLPEVLQRHTAMPVRAARDGDAFFADHVYVIPPGKHLVAVDGHLRLTELRHERGRRVAVDLFFRSLADTHGPHATAVVLSGADGDGAIGLKRIKERGGLTIAQDPAEAEHARMPDAAIATGMVDWVLRSADMPSRIARYVGTARRLRLPSEDGPVETAVQPLDRSEALLREVLALLQSRTGRDFTYYKRATIVRRISRRMQVSGVVDLADYLSHLRTSPGEAAALLSDLLISVTNFFRDRDAFLSIERHLPELFRGKEPGDAVRVWCPACATGEEAYSMAMLLLEHAHAHGHPRPRPPALQVFGCDLDENAIQVARAGFYPDTIATDVSEERLLRFFVKEPGGWRVRRELREMVLFASHDLLKDAPFSRMDLVSCRNLLIYLNRDAQARALEIFNFALKRNGLLFLGISESVDEGSALFTPVLKKHRIYRQRTVQRTGLPLAEGGSDGALHRVIRQHERLMRSGTTLPARSFLTGSAPTSTGGAGFDQAALPANDLHFRLLGRAGPASLVIDAAHEILHLSEEANGFLQMPEGKPTGNLLRLVHPMLRSDLRAALLRVGETGQPVEVDRRLVDFPGGKKAVEIRVTPAGDLAPGAALVIFQARESGASAPGEAAPGAASLDASAVVQQLERELTRSNAELRGTVEQYEASTEELRASNEELQAMNEELRSTGEELETGREELQSVNEELTTVNAEFRTRVEELGRANSDLHNLMNATQIATVFLDRDLQVMRYTPSAAPLFNLIPGDIGRPIAHLNRRLHYPELHGDAEQVLRTLVPVERELREDGHWYLARVLPYRTIDDRIAGVVLTFVDITERRRAEAASRESETRLRLAIEASDLATWEWNIAKDEAIWNERHFRLLGMTPHRDPVDMEGFYKHVHVDDRARVRSDLHRVLDRKTAFQAEFRAVTDGGELRWMSGYGRVVAEDAGGKPLTMSGVMSDITDRKQSEELLRESRERMQLIVENARDHAIFTTDLSRRITSWNSGAESILGYSQDDAIGRLADMIYTDEDRANGVPDRECREALAEGRASDERWHARRDGSRFWGSGIVTSMHDAGGAPIGLLKILRDQTAERHAKEALAASRHELHLALQATEAARDEAQAAGRAKDRFLAVLSHELRTPLTPLLLAAQVLSRNRSLPQHVLEALDIVQRNVRLETHLVDDLLDVTRIATGKMEIRPEPTTLQRILDTAVEVSRQDILAKGQHLVRETSAGEAVLEGDIKRLQQVFWNVLKNASKFTPEGGTITVASRVDGRRCTVEVRDTGAGFAPEAAERIFAAFEQGSDDVTRVHGGLGLGLAIARAIVEAHGGTIVAASAGAGQGATFTVVLPVREPI